jgi:pimeloyl-ACP methyl ester carboxylesterase
MTERQIVAKGQPSGLTFNLIRGGMRVLGHAAPTIASRVAEDLFMTPRRHRAPERETEALRTGKEFRIPFESGEISAWRWGSGPAVILAHGWEGRGSQMTPFVESFVSRGHSVVTYDAPGHGKSSGKRSSLPAFAGALRAVAAHGGSVSGVVAHSFGCAATALAMSDGLEVPRAVFIAPPLDPAEYTQRFGDILGLNDRVVAAMRQRIQDRFARPWNEYSLAKLARTQTAPLLVIHDRDDNETFVREGEEIVRLWRGARMVITEGLGHRRILRDGRVVEQVVEFITSPR